MLVVCLPRGRTEAIVRAFRYKTIADQPDRLKLIA
jgi:hypothetical protein